MFFVGFENLVLPAEGRLFFRKKEQLKYTILKVKTGPALLRNILGPVLNLDLDQFLTLKMCHFCVLFSETTILIVLSAKHANLETHKTEKSRIF